MGNPSGTFGNSITRSVVGELEDIVDVLRTTGLDEEAGIVGTGEEDGTTGAVESTDVTEGASCCNALLIDATIFLKPSLNKTVVFGSFLCFSH